MSLTDIQKNFFPPDENILKEKFRFFLAGLSLISLFILLPVLQFLNANPFFHFRFGMDNTLLLLILSCFGIVPILFFLFFVKFAIGQSRDTFFSRIILGASLWLFSSHLFSTTLHEHAPTLKASIILVVLALGTVAILKTYREIIWGLAWLSILVVPITIFHGYRQYLNIPELIRDAKIPAVNVGITQPNIYMIFLDGSQIASSYLDEDHFPKKQFLPNFRNFVKKDAHWFPNALANSPATYLSFPSMITGRLYVSIANNYLRHEKNIFSILEQRYQFHAFLYTKTSFCMEHPSSCLPYNISVYSTPLNILFEMYGFISTFRLYPIHYKIGEMNTELYNRQDYAQGFIDKVDMGSKKGNFYIIQLFDREESQLKDFDNFFRDFISSLKKKGAYEDAIIVIMSDHSFIPGPEPNYGPFVEQTKRLYNVPFAIKTSGSGQGKLYSYAAQSIDIAPTLLAQVLTDKELKSLKFDGVDVLHSKPQRGHFINFDKNNKMYKLLDIDGKQPGLVEVQLSQIKVSLKH